MIQGEQYRNHTRLELNLDDFLTFMHLYYLEDYHAISAFFFFESKHFQQLYYATNLDQSLNLLKNLCLISLLFWNGCLQHILADDSFVLDSFIIDIHD